MKKNFDVQVKNVDRNPALRIEVEKANEYFQRLLKLLEQHNIESPIQARTEVPRMLNLEIAEILCAVQPNDAMDIAERRMRGRLADKLMEEGEQEYDERELEKIRETCGKVLQPHILNQLLNILENNDVSQDN